MAGWCTAAAAAGMPPEAQCEAESEDKKNHDRVALLEVMSVNDGRPASLCQGLV
jgi:hypothetical protein